jgi:hypothetical protein
MCRSKAFIFSIILFICSTRIVFAQRKYTDASVFSAGNWYKIAIAKQGIYKIDAAFLKSLGIGLPLNSNAIQLFGNGGGMLPEANILPRIDDLLENNIWLKDGSDGSFSDSDYFLFYSSGPDLWGYSNIEKRFTSTKNLYSDSVYYYIRIGTNGKRIEKSPLITGAQVVNEFDNFYVQETDAFNFLSSGKEWYGETFGGSVGGVFFRDFNIPITNIIPGSPVTFYTSLVARSVGQPAKFEINFNKSLVQQLEMPALSGVAYEPPATANSFLISRPLSSNTLQIRYNFIPGTVNAQGWLNKFELNVRSKLDFTAQTQLLFQDVNTVGSGKTASFTLTGADVTTRVWDVSTIAAPIEMQTVLLGNTLTFGNETSTLHYYIAFTDKNALTPSPSVKPNNQNLHQPAKYDFIIIAPPQFFQEADRLGKFHLDNDKLSYLVATPEQIYNEFSSGTPDPTAIRDFIKMFYDRAAGNPANTPKYLLLFGDASFDYKKRLIGNTNLVPAFQSASSLDPLSSYTSDDFLGFLDDQDDINSVVKTPLLDIGIGRIPASTLAEAKFYVDKVIKYKQSFGAWRNQITFVADDEDQNIHLNDAEGIASTASQLAPILNVGKIYLDAYQQENSTGGSRYPSVNEAINRRMFSGNLIWNYSGHGGYNRLAQESILTDEMLNSWTNDKKLPLFITAACDFAPFDNPLISSLGEKLLLQPQTGGIALLTTTRLVFAFSNRIINENYFSAALQKNVDGIYPSLGQSLRQAKNYTYQTSGDLLNNRKFTLLGDPALTIGYPRYNIRTTSINGIPINNFKDTLKALNRYTITGEVVDVNGQLLKNFNGSVNTSVYDKMAQINTKGNDAGSVIVPFVQQQNQLFNGKSAIESGKFSVTFIVPKDINFSVGKAKISYYAENGNTDAAGVDETILVGGLGNGFKEDNEGPVIYAYLNDEKFVNGGITGENTVLLLKLKDSSGINTIGTGIGHDITATLDNNTNQVYILNDFYETAKGNYQEGILRFPFTGLAVGLHSLKIRVWDIFNNSSTVVLNFRVVQSTDLELSNVFNYPNPFTNQTKFWFEHNRAGEILNVGVKIMTITGKQVKYINKTLNSIGNRSDTIEWNGTDDFGNKLGRGVYLYQINVQTPDGKSVQKLQKLVIL